MLMLISLQAALIAVVSSARSPRPMENRDLYQGDIVGEDLMDRASIVDMNRRWPQGVIAYSLDPSVVPAKDNIEKAMRNIESLTCLRFVKYDGSQQDWIRIHKGNGCYSALGRTGGMQPLSIGENCEPVGVIIHELGHALGFHHEHQRSDRDDYIRVYWENIDPQFLWVFTKLKPEENWLISPFDYESIMVYPEWGFAKSGDLKTMVSKEEGVRLRGADEKTSLSQSDTYRIKILYNCQS